MADRIRRFCSFRLQAEVSRLSPARRYRDGMARVNWQACRTFGSRSESADAARILGRRHPHADARHRRQHRGLHGAQRCPACAAALCAAATDVVVLNEQTPRVTDALGDTLQLRRLAERAKSFSAMAAFRPTNMTLTGSGEPERVPAKMMSANLLPLLGVAIDAGPRLRRGRRPAGRRRRRHPERGLRRSADSPASEPVGQHAAARQPPLHRRRRAARRLRAVPAGRRLRARSVRGRRRCRTTAAGIRASSRSRG